MKPRRISANWPRDPRGRVKARPIDVVTVLEEGQHSIFCSQIGTGVSASQIDTFSGC